MANKPPQLRPWGRKECAVLTLIFVFCRDHGFTVPVVTGIYFLVTFLDRQFPDTVFTVERVYTSQPPLLISDECFIQYNIGCSFGNYTHALVYIVGAWVRAVRVVTAVSGNSSWRRGLGDVPQHPPQSDG
jgi:hypothetical protein